jgi:hypothetical protein
MATRKGSSSRTQQKHRRIVKEIEKKFGKVMNSSHLFIRELIKGSPLSNERLDTY